MKPIADIVFRDLDHSPALNDTILKKIEKLSRYHDAISHSRVVLDSPHNHKYKGKSYRASIELGLKGKPVTISQDNPSVHVAIRDAFNAAERKLKQISGRQRHHRPS